MRAGHEAKRRRASPFLMLSLRFLLRPLPPPTGEPASETVDTPRVGFRVSRVGEQSMPVGGGEELISSAINLRNHSGFEMRDVP